MYINQLANFHEGVGDGQVVFVPNNKFAQLRAKLIREEASELCYALENEDEEQVLKECCDLLYVVFGTAWTYDLPIWEAFKAVHENNMLKVDYPRNEFGKIVKPEGHPKVSLKNIIQRHRDDMA